MWRSAAAVGVAAAMVAITPMAGSAQDRATGPVPVATPARAPALNVSVLEGGLSLPWDMAFLDRNRYLLTERAGRIRLGNAATGALSVVRAPLGDLALIDSGGLMGLAVDPSFGKNRLFYTCQTHKNPNDVRVVRWRLAANGRSAVRVGAPLIQGIPFDRIHFGCRLLVMPGRTLLVGTGDGAIGSTPQDLDSLAGKILRVRLDGGVPANNPWATAAGPRRYVWNYGHRNIQGLALRPGTAQVFSAEHGPEWDDEVNRVLRKVNYGWDPVFPGGGPAYNQDVPMTDTSKFPAAQAAVWRSGATTVATSGMDFVVGSAWGSYNGAAFVAKLKDMGVMALTFTAGGAVTGAAEVPELNDRYGRLRTIRRGPDGTIYVLTSNGGSADKILRVTPRTSGAG